VPSNYKKGRRFEYLVAQKLRAKGFLVIRSAGSKGVFDLIAIANKNIYGIQCKTSNYVSKSEITKLIESGNKHGIIPLLATKQNKKAKLYVLDFTRADRLVSLL